MQNKFDKYWKKNRKKNLFSKWNNKNVAKITANLASVSLTKTACSNLSNSKNYQIVKVQDWVFLLPKLSNLSKVQVCQD